MDFGKKQKAMGEEFPVKKNTKSKSVYKGVGRLFPGGGIRFFSNKLRGSGKNENGRERGGGDLSLRKRETVA